MTGQPRYPGTGEDTGADREPPNPRQRRRRVLLGVAIALLAAFAVLVLALHAAGRLARARLTRLP